MPCYNPISVLPRDPAKGRGVTRSRSQSFRGALSFEIPCGKCAGCRMMRREDWKLRCVHEASMHEVSCFGTLTYADEFYPADGNPSKADFKLFIRRLRDAHPGFVIRYLACGEFGGKLWRAHFHFLLFGYGFPDRQVWSRSPSGALRYKSAELETLWPYGLSEVSDFTPQSAGYTVGYVMKKIGGDDAAEHYVRPHPVTGEIVQLQPEWLVMSRRPGIGAAWFDRFKGDAFPSDFLILDGKRQRVPRYYKLKLSKVEQLEVETKRNAASREALAAHPEEATPERMLVREEVFGRKVERLKRSFDEES